MKARETIVSAIAALVLVVPAVAGASATRTLPIHSVRVAAGAGTNAAKLKAAKLKAARLKAARLKAARLKAAKAKAEAAAAAKAAASGPISIYIPEPPVGSSAPYVDPNLCEDTGTACTDAQACEFWSVDCDSLGSGDQLGPGSGEAPTTGPTSAPAGSTSPSSGAASDANSPYPVTNAAGEPCFDPETGDLTGNC
jgi:hypothetical protein